MNCSEVAGEIMKALLIDSSNSACSVCITTDRVVIGHNYAPMERGHASVIVPMIQSTMTEAKTRFDELCFVAVTNGPGSFTGLRISLAAAKAIALSNNIPLYSVSCFDAIAGRVTANTTLSKTDLLLIAIESKRKELYLECLNKGGVKIIESQSLSAPDIITQLARLYQPGETVRIAGDAGSSLVKEIEKLIKPNGKSFTEDFRGVDALDITNTENFWKLFKYSENRDYSHQVNLQYLRKPDISIPKKQ